MAELLDIAGTEYAKTDDQAAGALGSSMQGSSGSGGSGAGGSPARTGPEPGQGAGGSNDLAWQMNLAQQAESEDEDPSAGDEAENEAEAEPRGATTSGEQADAAPVGTEPRRGLDNQRAVERSGE